MGLYDTFPGLDTKSGGDGDVKKESGISAWIIIVVLILISTFFLLMVK